MEAGWDGDSMDTAMSPQKRGWDDRHYTNLDGERNEGMNVESLQAVTIADRPRGYQP